MVNLGLRVVGLVICGILLSGVWGCQTSGVRASSGPRYQEKPGPPPHAVAHGYRKKYAYRYYPSAQVYFDTGRRLYFYLEGGHWRSSMSLPASFRLDVREAVPLEMDTATPYLEFETHKAKYPPGQLKKMKGQGKEKGKGKQK